MARDRREYMREYQRKWIAQRRADYFADKACVRCGSTEQLELDHINRTTKRDHRIWSWSAERREAELVNCQVLCHDCHQYKTSKQRVPAPHGSASKYTAGCRCDRCKEARRDRERDYRRRSQ